MLREKAETFPLYMTFLYVGMKSERIRLKRIKAVKAPGVVPTIADFTEELKRLGSSQLRKREGGKDG